MIFKIFTCFIIIYFISMVWFIIDALRAKYERYVGNNDSRNHKAREKLIMRIKPTTGKQQILIRHKLLEYEAIKYTGGNVGYISAWSQRYWQEKKGTLYGKKVIINKELSICAYVSEWILKDSHGVLSVLSDNEIKRSYSHIKRIPKFRKEQPNLWDEVIWDRRQLKEIDVPDGFEEVEVEIE